MSLITVLTPAYNAGQTIRRAIKSVVSMRHKIQQIVIDDASTDDTSLRLRAAFIDVIRMEKNSGPAAALNAAIPFIRGDYVITLEADDALEFGALDALAKLMDAGAGFAYGWTKYHGRQRHVHVPRMPADIDHFRERFESLYAVMFRREALERGACWHTFQAGYGLHDWDFTLQLIALGYQPAVHDGLVLHYEFGDGLNARLHEKNAEYLEELKERHPAVRAVRI